MGIKLQVKRWVVGVVVILIGCIVYPFYRPWRIGKEYEECCEEVEKELINKCAQSLIPAMVEIARIEQEDRKCLKSI